jgi:DNA-directed RNA polymerase alpha subunit
MILGIEGQTIAIPLDARSWQIAQLPLSVRLGHVLETLGCKSLGDLHGRTYEQVLEVNNCGQKTITELQQLVSQLHKGKLQCVVQNPNVSQSSRQAHSRIFVPQNARGWALNQLPLSQRLVGVLLRLGYHLLGDLHGKSLAELRKQKNCGRQTIAELQDLISRV